MSLLNPFPHAFGLDIGDLSFKIVSFKKKGKKIKLEAHGEKKVPVEFFSKGEIIKKTEVAKLIKDFVKELKISTPYVVAVLPETKTFIKIIDLPKEKESIDENIKKEIESRIPLKIEEVYFDWQTISQDKINNKALIALTPKDVVSSYLETLKMAGLRPVSLEVESIAISRALIKEKDLKNQPKLIIDLGATRSSLIIVDEDVLQLTISLPFSGQKLTEKITEELKIDSAEAEKIKINYQDQKKNESDLEKIINQSYSSLSQSVANHIRFYEENSGKKIKEIILCGGGANLFEITTFIEKELKIKTIKGDPWTNFLTQKPAELKNEPSVYTTAIGLGLRGIQENI